MLEYTDKITIKMLTAYAASASAAEKVSENTASELANLFQLLIAKIPLWIAAFVVIIMTFIFARIARMMVENKMAEKGIEEEHKEIQILGGRMTYAGLVIIGITVGLKIAGIDLTAIIAAGAFGIGFALKDLIMNFLAGVMILISRHFSIGDFINVGGTIGKIVEIQARNTVLQAVDGTKVIVPNAQLFKNQVTSFTSNPFRRIEIVHGVDYRSNLENVYKICIHVLKTTKGVLVEPKPSVLFYEFGDYSINFKLRAWVDSKSGWMKIKHDLMLNLNKALNENNIDVAWPINQLVMDKDCEHDNEKMFEKSQATKAKSLAESAQPLEVEPAAKNQPAEAQPVTPQITQIPVTTAQVSVPVNEFEQQPLKPLGEQR